MQEAMSSVAMPFILALGFLIGILLLVLGYRELDDRPRRNRLMGLGTIIIGVMIPVTPVSWYGYWMLAAALVLGTIELAVIAVAVILGIVMIYQGAKTYTKAQ